MRYQFIGTKVDWVGKTLWEIVGNLKNFGVGRLVKKWEFLKYPEPSFLKIVRVQPVEAPKKQFANREVLVWVEEVFRGRKLPMYEMRKDTSLPKFQLIPKSEEEKYWKEAEVAAKNFKLREIPKYSFCPPLYKLIWESQHLKKIKTFKPMPNLNVVITEDLYNPVKISEEESTSTPSSTELYITNMSVEDMIKEIVKLKKIIKAHSIKSEP